ncbi:hypothetical protein GIB67_016927 [Kingdonia uniflora]|uniref:Uncharacterized protein n=1 Tax=Kingdonia uniflora TaxID=39325 RepID=A0A7J7M3E1_9MAGN|nr:hypothetical protein GIB67_016927 [Kingdonia uniflora]
MEVLKQLNLPSPLLLGDEGDIDWSRRPWELVTSGHTIGIPEPLFEKLGKFFLPQTDEDVSSFKDMFAGSQTDQKLKQKRGQASFVDFNKHKNATRCHFANRMTVVWGGKRVCISDVRHIHDRPHTGTCVVSIRCSDAIYVGADTFNSIIEESESETHRVSRFRLGITKCIQDEMILFSPQSLSEILEMARRVEAKLKPSGYSSFTTLTTVVTTPTSTTPVVGQKDLMKIMRVSRNMICVFSGRADPAIYAIKMLTDEYSLFLGESSTVVMMCITLICVSVIISFMDYCPRTIVFDANSAGTELIYNFPAVRRRLVSFRRKIDAKDGEEDDEYDVLIFYKKIGEAPVIAGFFSGLDSFDGDFVCGGSG